MKSGELSQLLKLHHDWLRVRPALLALKPIFKEAPDITLAALAKRVTMLDPLGLPRGRPSHAEAVVDVEQLTDMAGLMGARKATREGLSALGEAFGRAPNALLGHTASTVAAALNSERAEADWRRLERERETAARAARITGMADQFRDARPDEEGYAALCVEMAAEGYTAREWRAVVEALTGEACPTKKIAVQRLQAWTQSAIAARVDVGLGPPKPFGAPGLDEADVVIAASWTGQPR